jgi:TonB family protein
MTGSLSMRTAARFLPLAALAVVLGCASRWRGVTRADHMTTPKATSCANRIAIDATEYDTTQVSERPVIRTWPQLRYPDVALRNHITGHVVIAFVVSTVGVVDISTVRIVNSAHPALDAEGIAYVTGSTYWPGCLNGKAVRVRLTVPIDFKIR